MNRENNRADVLILGGGPAGLACALELGGSGLQVVLLEKDRYPREKICGDALGPDVLAQVSGMPGNLYSKFMEIPERHPVYSMQLFYPEKNVFRMDFRKRFGNAPPGYILARKHFDKLLYSTAAEGEGVRIVTGQKLSGLQTDSGEIRVKAGNRSYSAAVAVVATGAVSAVTRELAGWQTLPGRSAFAFRAYFGGLEPDSGDDCLYFYFLSQVLPGYLWIFPAGSGVYNVGAGMPVKKINAGRVSLKKEFSGWLKNDPRLAPVFRKAELLSPVQGHPIPCIKPGSRLSGNRFLLTGDAAGVVNPLTGEGVGNALRTGVLAARYIMKRYPGGNFDAVSNREYDRMVWEKIRKGLILGSRLQALAGQENMVRSLFGAANYFPSLKRRMKGMVDRL